MARKDRERARRRHVIERARRETATDAPEQQEDQKHESSAGKGDAKRSTDRRRALPPKAGINPYSGKGKVGDLDPRGRVRTRSMLVHPRVTVPVILIAFVLSLPGVIMPLVAPNTQGWIVGVLRVLTFAGFAVSFLGIADLAPTWPRTLFPMFASMVSAGAVVLAIATVFQ